MYNVGEFTNQGLLTLANDIYDLENNPNNGIKPDSFFKTYDKKIGENEYPSLGQFSDDVVKEAADRFEKLIKVTMRKCAYKFITK